MPGLSCATPSKKRFQALCSSSSSEAMISFSSSDATSNHSAVRFLITPACVHSSHSSPPQHPHSQKTTCPTDSIDTQCGRNGVPYVLMEYSQVKCLRFRCTLSRWFLAVGGFKCARRVVCVCGLYCDFQVNVSPLVSLRVCSDFSCHNRFKLQVFSYLPCCSGSSCNIPTTTAAFHCACTAKTKQT